MVTNQLQHPTRAMYLRIVPRAWQNKVALRVEVYGCSWSRYMRSERTSDKDHAPHVNSFWKWKDRKNCLNRRLKTSCNFIIFFSHGLTRFTLLTVVYTAAHRTCISEVSDGNLSPIHNLNIFESCLVKHGLKFSLHKLCLLLIRNLVQIKNLNPV